MGCCGDREKYASAKNEQKWDYINLSDFRSTSCWTPFSYGILYLFLVTSLACYAVDLFTAANLLFFNRWSGQVQPAIPFKISKWIFAGCIILSWILLGYRWWRALRAMNSGAVAASYLDPLAVRVQSIRTGANGRGWRRFLVFAALTEGRKGAEYVALFTYFSFEAWLRIVFAEGPRQVINALTLYSVMQADLLPKGQHAAQHGHTPVVQFFVNLQILAGHNKEQAAILFGMLYTLIIWVISAISLILAILMYLVFLWHHIPSADGSLSKYCRRKIDSRLHKIVMAKVNKALAKEEEARAKNDLAKPGFAGVPARSDFKRQPTLPILDTDAGSQIQPISRQTTQSDLTPFEPRPQTPSGYNPQNDLSKEPTVPDVFGNPQRPDALSRNTTQSSLQSDTSYASDAPLISSAGEMGYDGQYRSYSRNGSRPPMGRSITGNSQGAQRSYNSSRMGPPSRQNTDMSFNAGPRTGPPSRQNTDMSGRMTPAPSASQSQGRKPMLRDPSSTSAGRRTPGPPAPSRRPTQEYEMYPPNPVSGMNKPSETGGYTPYSPNARNLHPVGIPTPSSRLAPSRNFTLPHRPPRDDYFSSKPLPPQRSGTAPIPQTAGYDDSIYDSYGASDPPASVPFRPATAGPAPGGWNGQGRAMSPRY